jgi:hypothetical protein
MRAPLPESLRMYYSFARRTSPLRLSSTEAIIGE